MKSGSSMAVCNKTRKRSVWTILTACCSLPHAVSSWVIAKGSIPHYRRCQCPSASQLHGQPNKKTEGYQFGDLTRNLMKKSKEKINEITGKEDYEFGDLSRWADRKAKEHVKRSRQETKSGTSTTNESHNEYNYQFGDLSRWATDLAKEKGAQYAGKDGSDDYAFGDITRTIFAKVQSGEYQVDDVYLALRILVVAGFSILPVANLLPVKLLLQVIEVDLAKDVGGKLTSVLATSVDSRVKEALTGDSNYKLGDLAKTKLSQSLSKFTGKEAYEFGDISKTIAQGFGERRTGESGQTPALSQHLQDSLSEWDARFLEDEHKKDDPRKKS